MSIILDALKKSERERQAGQVPGMSEVVNETSIARPRWIPWVVAMLVLLNVGGIGYWLYRDKASKPPVPSQVSAVSGEIVMPQKEGLPVAVPQVQAPLTDVRPPVEPVQVIPPPEPVQQRPAIAMPEHLMPPANPTRGATEEDDPVDAELEAEGGTKSETLMPRSPAGSGLPMINDMPEAFRSRIPSFRITMFAFSENPQDRFIIVNMKKLVAGDVLPGGVLLIEIRAENLVGELDGQKFLIPRF
ncbi:MAG: hypothetical protein RLZ25_2318 [Pseudomonadota bacterium]|jgi:general secretion pathway protein B